MVTITQPEEVGEVGEREVKKRTILVMSRQQPGESPASYVVQGRLGNDNIIHYCSTALSATASFVFMSGLIDFLVSKHKIAAELREKLIFKVSCSGSRYLYFQPGVISLC